MPYISRDDMIKILKNDENTIEELEKKHNLKNKKCLICGSVYFPKDKRMIYCENCRNVSYDTKIQKDEEKRKRRNEYKKMHIRMCRGNITKEEFEEWRKENYYI